MTYAGLECMVKGSSMMPMLPPGTLVYLEPVDPTLVRTGDVVAARAPSGEWLLHRVCRVANQAPVPYLILQGDASVFADPPVLNEWLEGRLTRVKLPTSSRWCRPRPWIARLMAYSMTRLPARLGLRLRRAIGLLTLSSRNVSESSKVPANCPIEAPLPPTSPNSVMTQPSASGCDPSSIHHDACQHNERFHLQRVGDEWALHDRQTGELHLLNHTAAMVFEWKVEGKTEDEIVGNLHERFPDVSPDRLRSDVDLTLKRLTSLATRN